MYPEDNGEEVEEPIYCVRTALVYSAEHFFTLREERFYHKEIVRKDILQIGPNRDYFLNKTYQEGPGCYVSSGAELPSGLILPGRTG